MGSLRGLVHALGGRCAFLMAFAAMCAVYEYGRVLHLMPLPIHIWRQGDCLSLTWNYFTGDATILEPVIHSRFSGGSKLGVTAGEFPILYWAMGQIWKITGPSEFLYRLFGLLLHALASFMLFLTLRRSLKSIAWSLLISLLLFTSPVLVYYSVSFLTDVPAFDFALIGWYGVVRYGEDRRRRWWIVAMVAFALAMLLKVTAGMSFLALFGVYALACWFPGPLAAVRDRLPPWRFGWGVIAAAFAAIAAWYIHAEMLNRTHHGRYTFNGLWPIWEMTPDQIDGALTYAKTILLFQVFDTSVWLVLGAALILLLHEVRRLPLGLSLLNGFLLIGTVVYTLFWFHAVDGHDYYFINPIITLLILLTSSVWWIRQAYPQLFFSRALRWAFLLLLVYNVAYARTNLIMRSQPGGAYSEAKLWPTYHCKEPGYWNAIADPVWRNFYTLAPYLDSIGISRDELAISPDDVTINTSLYMMRRHGFSHFGIHWNEPGMMEHLIDLGASFMVRRKDRISPDDPYKPWMEEPMGRYGPLLIYDLRRDPLARTDTVIHFEQNAGKQLPLPHRNNARICEGAQGWCFGGEQYPMEMEDLPVHPPDLKYAEVIVSGTLAQEPGHEGSFSFAVSQDLGDQQSDFMQQRIQPGPFKVVFKLPAFDPDTRNKLYLENNTGSPFRLEELEVLVVRHLPSR